MLAQVTSECCRAGPQATALPASWACPGGLAPTLGAAQGQQVLGSAGLRPVLQAQGQGRRIPERSLAQRDRSPMALGPRAHPWLPGTGTCRATQTCQCKQSNQVRLTLFPNPVLLT